MGIMEFLKNHEHYGGVYQVRAACAYRNYRARATEPRVRPLTSSTANEMRLGIGTLSKLWFTGAASLALNLRVLITASFNARY